MSIRLRSGTIIDGRYRLEQPLGEGGIGVVWEAWQTGVERRVAIKFLKMATGGAMGQRFEVEARALGRLNHPNCVTIYDFGQTERGLAYLAMEFLEGEPATAWRGRRLTIRDVVDIGQQVATALHYAHHHGVVHRDLKPENIFAVSTLAGDRLIKVLDFGLAKLTNQAYEDITKTGEVFGTPAYMSPEQLRGTREAGPASDLYSLGVMLYELLEGRLPFWEGTPLEIGMAHITKPVPPLRRPGVGERMTTIIHTLLAKNPDDRYSDALELFDALDQVETEAQETTLQLVIPASPRDSADAVAEAFAQTAEQVVAPTDELDAPVDRSAETPRFDPEAPVDGSAETPRFQAEGPKLELADVQPPPRVVREPEPSNPQRRISPGLMVGVVGGVLVGAALAAALLWPEQPVPTEPTGPVVEERGPSDQYPTNVQPGVTIEATERPAAQKKQTPAAQAKATPPEVEREVEEKKQDEVAASDEQARPARQPRRSRPKRKEERPRPKAERADEEESTESRTESADSQVLKNRVTEEIPDPKGVEARGLINPQVVDTEGK